MGSGPSVLFLHGLAGSHRYWGKRFDAVGTTRRLVMPDLAGFGESMWLPGPYGFEGQLRWFEGLFADDGPTLLVGHSFGALLALLLASRWPCVRKVVAFNIPAYSSAEEARAYIRHAGRMERWIADEDPIAETMCAAMCRFRRTFRLLAPLFAPTLPISVARDGVLHTWTSFKQVFDAVVEDARPEEWLAQTDAKVTVVLGDADEAAPTTVVQPLLAAAGAEVLTLPGRHHLPLTATKSCRRVVLERA